MQVEAVLFDLFNTLILLEDDDSFYIPSLKKLHEFLVGKNVNVSFETFKRVYFEVRDRLYTEAEKDLKEPHFNVRISLTLQKLGYDLGVSHPTVVGATNVFCGEFERYTRLDEDAVNILQILKRKCKLGIVSNFAIPECALSLLKKHGLREFFDVVVVSAQINIRKPSPQIFEKALKKLGIDASRAVFVGDTPSMDIKGARNAGIKAILICRKPSPPSGSISLVYRPPEEDTNIEPDETIQSLNELPTTLEKD
jgi:putative hydrolase of the HAD superfamily